MNAAQQAGRIVEQGTRQATDSSAVRLTARIGLVGYGVVHLLVALLALRVAAGDHAEPGKTGALQAIAEQPAGRVMLWVLAAGFAALVVWELAEAAYGHQHVRPERRRTVRRLASAGEAVVFALLAWMAARLAGSGQGHSSAEQRELTAKILELPGGQFLVGAIGVGIMVGAGYCIRRGVTAAFVSDLDLSRADPAPRRLAVRLGRAGWTAVGIAYGIVGLLVVVAAVQYDPNQATGLDTALHTLAAQPYGPPVLAVLAGGLACFGLYCLFDARYRRG